METDGAKAFQLPQALAEAARLVSDGSPARARAIYERILEMAPDHAEAVNNLGVLAAQSGNYQDAIAYFERSIAADGAFANAHYNKATALAALSKFSDSLPWYERTIELNSNHRDAYLNKSIALLKLTRIDEALATADQAIALDSNNSRGFVNKAILLDRMEAFHQALVSADQAIKLAPDTLDAHLVQADIFFKLGRFSEAIEALDRVIGLNPGSAETHSDKARVLMQTGELEDALACIDLAIALDPSSIIFQNLRGAILFAAHKFDDALAQFNEMLSNAPDHAEGLLGKGRCLHRLNRNDEALAIVAEQLRIQSEDAPLLRLQGQIFAGLGGFKDALASFDLAFELSPEEFPDDFYQYSFFAQSETMGRSPLPSRLAEGLAQLLAEAGLDEDEMRSPASVPKPGDSEWVKRFQWGRKANILVHRWVCFNRDEHEQLNSIIDGPDWTEVEREMGRGSGVVLGSAHLGPHAIAGHALIQSGLPCLFVSNNEVFNCFLALGNIPFETGDRWTATRLAKFLRTGGAIFQIGDDVRGGTIVEYGGGEAAVRINNLPPTIAYHTKAPIYWYGARWQGRRIVIDLERAPSPNDGEPIEQWNARWFEFYLAKYNSVLSSPENLKTRHIRTGSIFDISSNASLIGELQLR